MKRKICLWLLSHTSNFKGVGTFKGVSEKYAEYIFKFRNFRNRIGCFFVEEDVLRSIRNAYIDGYIRCLTDNELEFRDGLIFKAEELPEGALKIYLEETHQDEIAKLHEEYKKQLTPLLGKFNANELVEKIKNPSTDKKGWK